MGPKYEIYWTRNYPFRDNEDERSRKVILRINDVDGEVSWMTRKKVKEGCLLIERVFLGGTTRCNSGKGLGNTSGNYKWELFMAASSLEDNVQQFMEMIGNY